MASSGKDWRSGGKSSRRQKPAAPQRPESPTKPVPEPAQEPTEAKDRSDWRKKKLGNEARAKSPAAAGKSYLQKPNQTHRQQVFRHRLKVGLWTGTSLLALGVLIAYLLYRPQQITLINVIVTEYQQPIPPNSYALEDGTLLAELEQTNRSHIVVDKGMDATRPKGEFLAGLDTVLKKVEPGGPNKNTYMVYLSAHGVVNENNEPCLMLSGADPLNSSTWLPVADLLTLLDQTGGPQPAESTKLLILDSGRLDEFWEAGLFYNGFADALSRTIAASGVKNVYVLHSCSPGERNWSGPEINGSSFGHYVARGLNGAADLNEDRTISLFELQSYVRVMVKQWAGLHRGATQNPQLLPPLPKNTKVALAYRWSTLKRSPAMVDTAPKENSKQLNDLWLEHERLLDNVKPYRYDPVGWAELQEDMLRLDSLLLAGDAYSDSFELLASEVANKQQRLSATDSSRPLGMLNMHSSKQLLGQVGNARDRQELQQIMSDRAKGIPIDPEKVPPRKPDSYLQALEAAWQWLLDSEAGSLTHERTRAALNMIDSAPNGPGTTEPIEAHYLRMLNRHIDWEGGNSLLSPLVRQALATRDTAERAASPVDERTIYWVQQTVDEADENRRQAEDRLFVGSNLDVAEAQTYLTQAGRNPEEGLYGQALVEAKQVAAAMALRDRVWSEMRYLVAWSLWEMKVGRQELKVPLQNLLVSAHGLGVALDDKQEPETIVKLHGQVETARDTIFNNYYDQVRTLTRTSSVDQDSIGKILKVLQLPLFSGTHRNDLRRRLIEELAQSQRDRGNEEMIEKPAEILKAFREIDGPWQPTDNEYLAGLGTLSEHPTLTMVDPENLGVPDAVKWSTPPRVAPPTEVGGERARQAAIASLAEQGADLRSHLLGVMRGANGGGGNLDRLYQITKLKMGDQYQADPLDARRGLSTADRLCRAAGPLMPELLALSIRRARTNPTTTLRDLDRYFQCLWMADRTMNDFWGPLDPGDPIYFNAVAKDLLASAKRLQPTARFARYGDRSLAAKLSSLVELANDSLVLSARDIGSYSSGQLAMLQGNILSKTSLPEGVASIALTSQSESVFPLVISNETRRRFAFTVGDQLHDEQINYGIQSPGTNGTNLSDQYQVVFRGLFRGHQFSTNVPVLDGDVPPNTIVTYYPPVRTPEVLVQGNVLQIPSVLFVFDCSGSMSKPASGEQKSDRMNVARQRLIDLLGENNTGDYRLPDRRFRVGLMLYGHRVGWEKNAPTVKRFSEFKTLQNANRNVLHPSLDSETVVPLTLLTKRVRDDMKNYLGDAKPHGQTPLYYSIKQALERFALDKAPSDSPRQIVVLTDGDDDPGTLASPGISSNAIVNLLNQPQYKSVRIDIVAFDFDANAGLTGLTTKTGGQLHKVTDSAKLEAAFDALLTPIKYHVKQATASPSKDDAVPLGVRNPLDDWNLAEVQRTPAKAQYKVDVFGADQPPGNTGNLELLGGEALEMQYNQDSRFNRLEHLEYDPDEFNLGDRRTTEVSVTKNDPQRKFEVKAFVPKRILNELQFDVSVQDNKSWPFTPRPKRMWVEIKPANSSSNSDDSIVFNYFDQSLVPGMPVPVYRYTVQEWPRQASEAEVRVWLLMDDLPPTYSRTLEQKDSAFELTNDTLRQQLPGSQFSVKVDLAGQKEAFTVTVVEKIAPGGKLYNTCVDIWPRPAKVTHSYQDNQAEHKFEFDKALTVKPRLVIWSRKSIEENAVPIIGMQNKPMLVRVPEL